jgi:uncharacterized protein (TIGR03066 family)
MTLRLFKVLLLLLFLTSIAPSQEKIVGFWEVYKVSANIGLKKQKMRRAGNGFILQFRDDGVVTTGRRIDKKKETKSGTYLFDADKMTLEISDVGPKEEEPMKVLKLTSKKLVFRDKRSTIYLRKIKE